MDIILKEVEVNTGYITFVCPACGADVHVNEDDTMDIYWMIRQIHRHKNPVAHYGSSRLPSGECAVCGCKE